MSFTMLTLAPVSASRTNVFSISIYADQNPTSLSQPCNITAGYWVEVDLQISSRRFVLFVVDDGDWYAHMATLSPTSPFDHPYAQASGYAGSSTAYAQIPSTGEYWFVFSNMNSPYDNNTGSCEVWLWDQTPPGQSPLGALGALPLVIFGVLGVVLVLIIVPVLKSRQPSKASDPSISTIGQCIVCKMQIGGEDSLVRCPSCGGIAHRVHMLEWLHVHDTCPACKAHIDEGSLKPGNESQASQKTTWPPEG